MAPLLGQSRTGICSASTSRGHQYAAGLAFQRLGNESRARQNWAVAVETYRLYPYHLWDLALALKVQGSYQLSIRAAYYLYALSQR